MQKRLTKVLLLIGLPFLLTNCTFHSLLKSSYTHLAPKKYPSSNEKPVYVDTAYSAQSMYNALFNDFLLIGKSSFTAKNGSASQYINYGREVGADVIIVSFQNMQKDKEHFSITEKLLWDTSLDVWSQSVMV